MNEHWEHVPFLQVDSLTRPMTMTPLQTQAQNENNDASQIFVSDKSPMAKPLEMQTLLSLFAIDQEFVFEQESFMSEVVVLYDNIEAAQKQLYIDIERSHVYMNETRINKSNYDSILNFIEYNCVSKWGLQESDFKNIVACCTQAIMSIPLKMLHVKYDLQEYVIGETNNKDDHLQVNLCTDNEENVYIHIFKNLRVFDMYSTLYYLNIQMRIPLCSNRKEQWVSVSIKPYL